MMYMACVEVTATRWSCDHETALDSVVERVRATELLVFLLMSNIAGLRALLHS